MAMRLVPPSFLLSRLPNVMSPCVGQASWLMASRMISPSSAKDSSLASATSWKLVLSAPMPVFLLNDFAAARICISRDPRCHLSMRPMLQSSQTQVSNG